MPKSIYVQFLLERPNASIHYLNRLVKLLNHYILIEPLKRTKGYESHHIVPKAKSWKPEWSKEPDNLLKIPTKAHYVIHHLMWKAFPKDYAMTKAFQRINTRLKRKITAKVYEVLRLEFSKIQSRSQKERVDNRTHHFLSGEIQKKTNAKRIANGTHPFLGGDVQSKNNLKRVANNTHPFLGGEIQKKINAKRVSNRTHQFLGSEVNNKRITDGNHPSQIKKTCPHCRKNFSLLAFGRYHGDKCRQVLGIDVVKTNPLP